MGGVKKCCVPGCEDKTSPRHRFPVYEKDIYETWLKRIQNDKIALMHPMQVYNTFRICESHFIPSCRMEVSKRMKPYSLPTLHLPGFYEEPSEKNSFLNPYGPLVGPESGLMTNKIQQSGELRTSTSIEVKIGPTGGPSTSFSLCDATATCDPTGSRNVPEGILRAVNSTRQNQLTPKAKHMYKAALRLKRQASILKKKNSFRKRLRVAEEMSNLEHFQEWGANKNTGSTTSAIQDIPDTITNDTPTNVSELETNVKHLEFDKSINEPDSPGNVSAGESNLFGCPMCCEKQFSLMDLQQHISRYIWGSLKCPVCDEVCVGLEILAVHLDEHHSDQEMTLSENSLLTNVAKSTVSSEESVNISCGDVRDQVIKHQTNILTEVEVDKERITVDKSVNHNKNTGGSEKQDMEICVPLKNNITSPCNTFSSKNISNRSKFVKKTDINVSSVVKQTSLAYKTRSLRHRPRLLIKNITDLQTPNVSSTSLEKTLKPQFSDEVPIDIMKRYTHNSGITKTSFVPVTNILDNKQRLITNWCENCKNVSTSSQKTETRVGATHCMDSNCEICCHKCGISFISERPCV